MIIPDTMIDELFCGTVSAHGKNKVCKVRIPRDFYEAHLKGRTDVIADMKSISTGMRHRVVCSVMVENRAYHILTFTNPGFDIGFTVYVRCGHLPDVKQWFDDPREVPLFDMCKPDGGPE